MGRSGDRRHRRVSEESPRSKEHDAGQHPGGATRGKGHRKRPPDDSGKGEKVVQETTGVGSNVGGQATPIGSKTKQERNRHAVGNGSFPSSSGSVA